MTWVLTVLADVEPFPDFCLGQAACDLSQDSGRGTARQAVCAPRSFCAYSTYSGQTRPGNRYTVGENAVPSQIQSAIAAKTLPAMVAAG